MGGSTIDADGSPPYTPRQHCFNIAEQGERMQQSEEDSQRIFRAPLGRRIQSVVFVLASLVIVALCWVGITGTEGFQRTLMELITLFPVLTLLAAILRMLSLLSRRVTLRPAGLAHVQLWKNYEVPWAQLLKVEVRELPDGGVDTLRIRWHGTPFYLDGDGLADFEVLFQLLQQQVPAEKWAVVETFESLEEP